MYLPYTYLITNKITNQFYYGSRFRNNNLQRNPSDDLWIHYFTSSVLVKALINEHGADSFSTVVLLESDYETCFWSEQKFIKENIRNPLCLNKQYTDPDTKDRKIFSSHGKKCTEKTRLKLSKIGSERMADPEIRNKYCRPKTEQAKQNMRSGGTGKATRTEYGRKKLSDCVKSRPKIECVHCGIICSPSNHTKWHGDKCKRKTATIADCR